MYIQKGREHKSSLSCDWSKSEKWCRLQHFTTCLRPEEHEGKLSIAYVQAGGRLGNAMSTYAAMLALKDQFGIDSTVDLATFQSLDKVFNNVKQVDIL